MELERAKHGERCGGCGYWLRGLGNQGRCPECGTEFRPEEFIIFSRDASPKHFIAFGAAMTAYVVVMGLLLLFHRGSGWRGAWPGLVSGFVAPLVTTLVMMRRRQVRLSQEGWGTRIGYGAVKMKKWEGRRMELRRARNGVYLFSIKRKWSANVLMQIGCPENDVEELRARMLDVTGQNAVLK